ncbi:tetratricopeptide repeat protein, partial [Streptomyces bobili]
MNDVERTALRRRGGPDLVDTPHDSTAQHASDARTALDELRRRLEEARESKDRAKDWLETRTGLSHGTVSAAFSPAARAPSKRTVRLLAKHLGLAPEPLLNLLDTAASSATAVSSDAYLAEEPGVATATIGARPLHAWTAKRLGVHPAISGNPARQALTDFVLPAYVSRQHDEELRAHLAASSAAHAQPTLVLVRGQSCTGKTRTAYEAVREAVPGDFRLLFPIDAGSLLEVLQAGVVTSRTVLWLNEAQDYLTGPDGEAVAAALLRRLDGVGPLLVIATLWPTYDETLSNRPSGPGDEDPHRHARALLAQALRIYLPRSFAGELDAVGSAAGDDPSLAAVMNLGTVNVTQTLAAGPDLVEHYEHPVGDHGTYGHALISAAMDAHRLGATHPLPVAFLQHAAPGYLTEAERAAADPNGWLDSALAYARQPIKEITSAFLDVPNPSGMGPQPGVIRLIDYLQQHGRHTRWALCPPATFWASASQHLPAHADLIKLANAAQTRHRYRHAAILHCAAADAGDTATLRVLARLRKAAGDLEGAERLYQEADDTESLVALKAELAELRAKAGDLEGAERLYQEAAEAGDDIALRKLVQLREQIGDTEGAERFARQAADAGNELALHELARLRKAAGDLEGAERLYQEAAEAGDDIALRKLVQLRE